MRTLSFALAIALGFSLIGCGGASNEIAIDGSSTVEPMATAVAKMYKAAGNNSTNVAVSFSGTGGGFQAFASGDTDISNASRPIKPAEAETCAENNIEFIELPVALDGLSIVIKKGGPLDGAITSITFEELATIFSATNESAPMTWNEVNEAWPNAPISLYVPGENSGTYDFFTEEILDKGDIREADNILRNEDDNDLVRGVNSAEAGMGFFGYAYYIKNDDTLVALPISKDGAEPVAPTAATVEALTYPLSRPLFIYPKVSALETKPWVVDFVTYFLENAPAAAEAVGYVPLTADAYTAVKARFTNRVTGSLFNQESAKGQTITAVLTAAE